MNHTVLPAGELKRLLGNCRHSGKHSDEREMQGGCAFAEDLLHGFPHEKDEE